jgi:excisionase family DNA binding protein
MDQPDPSLGRLSRRLLRIEDIADRLAVSRSMAHKLIATRQLRSVRIGRAVRVRPEDLEEYLGRSARDA